MMYHRRVGLQGIPKPSNPSRGIRRVFPSHPSPSPRSGRAQLGESHLAGEEHIWAGQPLAGPGSAASLHGSARCSSGITGDGANGGAGAVPLLRAAPRLYGEGSGDPRIWGGGGMGTKGGGTSCCPAKGRGGSGEGGLLLVGLPPAMHWTHLAP